MAAGYAEALYSAALAKRCTTHQSAVHASKIAARTASVTKKVAASSRSSEPGRRSRCVRSTRARTPAMSSSGEGRVHVMRGRVSGYRRPAGDRPRYSPREHLVPHHLLAVDERGSRPDRGAPPARVPIATAQSPVRRGMLSDPRPDTGGPRVAAALGSERTPAAHRVTSSSVWGCWHAHRLGSAHRPHA